MADIAASVLDLSFTTVLSATYLDECEQLWMSLRDCGVAVLTAPSFGPCIQHLDAFFAGTPASKHAARSPLAGEGYTPLTGKELLGYRLGSGQVLPAGSADGTEGRAHMDQACCSLERLGHAVLRSLCRCSKLEVHPALLLGLLDDVPLRPGQASSSVLHASCYDGAGAAAAGGAGWATACAPLAFAPHHDRGVLTLVASACEAGLQVWLPAAAPGGAGLAAAGGGGGWMDVPLGPGRVAVLVGYSLSYALGGLLQPTLHRVRPLTVAGAPLRRLSLAFKLRFRPSARVDPAAVLQEAATQPARALPPPLVALELMDAFNVAHPLSINAPPAMPPAPLTPANAHAGPAAAAGAAAAAAAPAAAAAAAAAAGPRGMEATTNCKAAAVAQAGNAGATAAGARRRIADGPPEGEAARGTSRRVQPKRCGHEGTGAGANGAAGREVGRAQAGRLLCRGCEKDYANAGTLARHLRSGACRGQRGHAGTAAVATAAAAAGNTPATAGNVLAAAGNVPAAAVNVLAAARNAAAAAGNLPAAAVVVPAAAGNAAVAAGYAAASTGYAATAVAGAAAATGNVPAAGVPAAAAVMRAVGLPATAAGNVRAVARNAAGSVNASNTTHSAAAFQAGAGAVSAEDGSEEADAGPVVLVQLDAGPGGAEPLGPSPAGTIRLGISSYDGSVQWFRIPITQRFDRTKDAYCRLNGLRACETRWIHDGMRLFTLTPAQCEMEDGDVVDTRVEQIGD
ncbi:hypothetical protein TSOC_005920 [Tetrabaena socialis]|uniref:Uncharacterized protein n=1 Tax=Tetrabaena socialis TaxID=47790 RepID=A0A2J8A538_9CHLO|nr:hypothetical protein TSOC_005920 [Tetrabaena socialis]|eukprot:PNH07613.1 hypothetical protein TSOC_005920 [Tetrabaena socialis]